MSVRASRRTRLGFHPYAQGIARCQPSDSLRRSVFLELLRSPSLDRVKPWVCGLREPRHAGLNPLNLPAYNGGDCGGPSRGIGSFLSPAEASKTVP